MVSCGGRQTRKRSGHRSLECNSGVFEFTSMRLCEASSVFDGGSNYLKCILGKFTNLSVEGD